MLQELPVRAQPAVYPGQPAAHWDCCLGHRLWADLQSPSGGCGHCCGHLPVPDCLGGANWSCKTPPGVAIFLYDHSPTCIYCPVFSILCLFSSESGAAGSAAGSRMEQYSKCSK